MSAHRRPLLVIVSGAPGAGKTTLARTIAASLGLPLLCKDDLKEAIGDELGPPLDVPASQRLGLAAYRALYSTTRRFLEAGVDAVIESNFRRGHSEAELEGLVACSDARLVHCTASPATVRSRYAERYRRGARHPVHLDAQRADALTEDLDAGRFEPLHLDIPAIVVHTDEGYDPPLPQVLGFLARPAQALERHGGLVG